MLLHLHDPIRGTANLAAIAAHAGPWADATADAIGRLLPRTADPDMALNNFERLLAQAPGRERLPDLLAHEARGLEMVLTLLAASQFFADTLVADPDALAAVTQPAARNPSTAELTALLKSDVDAATDDAGTLRAFRRFRQRQMLRVGVNDVIRDRPLDEITRDLARVADASVEVALRTALRSTARKFGTPMTVAGVPARLTGFAFGKLGGDELNYSSDLDLMFVYDDDGETVGKRGAGTPTADFYTRVVQELMRLLSAHTASGFAYRVDLRLRPDGHRGPLARSFASTMSYYDVMGRTWERQALIKLRHVAGDAPLGAQFLATVEPFVYRKYFSFSEINEVKALKRQMEARAARGGADESDVKTGRGGIRDIEYTVQFLQLLNGGDLPAVRQRNTLLALEALEIAGCLTGNETYLLADAYRFLRKTEHRLQLLFDMQTHKLPESADSLRTLARRMGYTERTRIPDSTSRYEDTAAPTALAPQKRSPLDETPSGFDLDTRDLLVDPLDQFLKDLHDKTALNRTILDHLLHQTFPGSGSTAEPESDLILDPDPDDVTVQAVLGRYPFRDIARAYQNLLSLAREGVRFLSHRRCRHFLASIAPQLLAAVAETPDPDEALANLERVTASLGAKAVLYEVFSFHPPSLKFYVDICAGSPFLSGLLINNPGMIDELLDSLVLDQPRPAAELAEELAELLRGATDPEPILHSFQDKELLRVGSRDLLGKAPVRETTAGLSDIADAILGAAFDLLAPAATRKHGMPTAGAAPCRYALIGLGKLGGREISYHSDLDLLLLFEADGSTTCEGLTPTTNLHYFTDLMQHVIKSLTSVGPMGRLYKVDMRLRPFGRSGSLVLPLDEFRRYFAAEGDCQLWERQTLVRARVVRGDPAFAADVMTAIRAGITNRPWDAALADEVLAMRDKLQAAVSVRSLKRGHGGLADIEFLVQAMQIKYGRRHPAILQSNAWAALEALQAAGLLPADVTAALIDGYSFLRSVEARLRVVADRPLTEVPEAAAERDVLARRLGFEPRGTATAGDQFLTELTRVTADVRRRFLERMSLERDEAAVNDGPPGRDTHISKVRIS